MKEIQILTKILLQYIYNHNQFCIVYCHVIGDTPRITCHFTVLDEFKTGKSTVSMAKRSMCPARNQRVAGSIPCGDIYLHFEIFAACFPSLQVGGALANEIKHDNSPVVIVV